MRKCSEKWPYFSADSRCYALLLTFTCLSHDALAPPAAWAVRTVVAADAVYLL